MSSEHESDLQFTITESDIAEAVRFCSAFPKGTFRRLKPSEVVSPITMAILRTRPDGFPISTDTHIAIAHNDTADTLRSIFKRFGSGESTREQFSSAALPLLLRLRSEIEADEAKEIQELIDEHQDESN